MTCIASATHPNGCPGSFTGATALPLAVTDLPAAAAGLSMAAAGLSAAAAGLSIVAAGLSAAAAGLSMAAAGLSAAAAGLSAGFQRGTSPDLGFNTRCCLNIGLFTYVSFKSAVSHHPPGQEWGHHLSSQARPLGRSLIY